MCGNLQMGAQTQMGKHTRTHMHTHTHASTHKGPCREIKRVSVALACQQCRLIDGGICVGWRVEEEEGQ